MPGSPFHLASFATEGRIESRGRFVSKPEEQMTMFLLDPSGNALDLKSLRQPAHVFTA